MIRSMTAYGHAEGRVGDGGTGEVAARSVNHRFLDLTVKLRDGDGALEPVIRKAFSSHVSRGKVEISLRIRRETGGARSDVSIDEELLSAIVAGMNRAAERLGLAGTLALRDLIAIPGVVSVDNPATELGPDEISDVERLASEAARSLVAMREVEGREIAADFTGRIETLRRKTADLAARREEVAVRLLASLRDRLAALVPGLPVDSGRLEQEAAIAVDRSDVAEELQRLDGHLVQFQELLESTGPVGKKLEFLTQEILRELNTLGSKARDLHLVRDVLDMKSETEKIREQVQNVE